MAKGDSGETQNLLNQQQKTGQAGLDKSNAQTQNQYGTMLGNYNAGTGSNLRDYGNVMSAYQQFLGGGNPTFGNANSMMGNRGMGQPTMQPNANMGFNPSQGQYATSMNLGLGGATNANAGGASAGAMQTGPASWGKLPSNDPQSFGNLSDPN